MSRINIIIIGLLSSTFLIFLCISLHIESYYEELNLKNINFSTKNLNRRPIVKLRDRTAILFDLNVTSSLSEENKKLTLLNSEIPSKDNNSSFINSLTIPENNITSSNSSLYELQTKILLLLKNREITFEKNSVIVSQDGKDILDEVYTICRGEHFKLEIYGHTDARGKRNINQEISQIRANSVKNYLIKKGIPFYDIKAKGLGESNLILKDKPYNRKNRRVEIYIKRK